LAGLADLLDRNAMGADQACATLIERGARNAWNEVRAGRLPLVDSEPVRVSGEGFEDPLVLDAPGVRELVDVPQCTAELADEDEGLPEGRGVVCLRRGQLDVAALRVEVVEL